LRYSLIFSANVDPLYFSDFIEHEMKMPHALSPSMGD
jgi:hypothetical protein